MDGLIWALVGASLGAVTGFFACSTVTLRRQLDQSDELYAMRSSLAVLSERLRESEAGLENAQALVRKLSWELSGWQTGWKGDLCHRVEQFVGLVDPYTRAEVVGVFACGSNDEVNQLDWYAVVDSDPDGGRLFGARRLDDCVGWTPGSRWEPQQDAVVEFKAENQPDGEL